MDAQAVGRTRLPSTSRAFRTLYVRRTYLQCISFILKASDRPFLLKNQVGEMQIPTHVPSDGLHAHQASQRQPQLPLHPTNQCLCEWENTRTCFLGLWFATVGNEHHHSLARMPGHNNITLVNEPSTKLDAQ